MDTPTLLKLACILFVVAALGGLTMAYIRFSGERNPPNAFVLGHGVLGAIGLVILLYLQFTVGLQGNTLLALVLLAAAAAGGGAMNLMFHRKGVLIPKGFVLGHAAIAAVGLVMLCTAAF